MIMFFTKYNVSDKFMELIFGKSISDAPHDDQTNEWVKLVKDPNRLAQFKARIPEILDYCHKADYYFEQQGTIIDRLLVHIKGSLVHVHIGWGEDKINKKLYDDFSLISRYLTDVQMRFTSFTIHIQEAEEARILDRGIGLISAFQRLRKVQVDMKGSVKIVIDHFKAAIKDYQEVEKDLEDMEEKLERL